MSSITITAGSHPDSYAADPVGSQGVVVGEDNTYDKEADVLYINFKKPSHADDSELTDYDLVIRYEKGMSWGSLCSMRAEGGVDLVYDRAHLDSYPSVIHSEHHRK